MTPRAVQIVLFDGFELLDVFGPVELFGLIPEHFAVTFLAPDAAPVRSSQGVTVNADHTYATAPEPDIILVPGGVATREVIRDEAFLSWLRAHGTAARLVTSVCTGSALLAAAGLLEGYRATSNKMAFRWTETFGESVDWVAHARWVEDRDRWTSSGVAAGMDMTVALIRALYGDDVAAAAAGTAELDYRTDSTEDPFAALHGL
ncbi:thiamine biosynthesis protein ThiJ [Tsukamurella pulmonis]|uniref:DJ-1/PfpI family protein n=1 Tax=Tsukamurella pulmonis TaxID=47312 RepID=UPI0007984636|nr:DJ-1/PfpI family protein [Tsukamurella pulmonis]KXP09243.1 thiamine biosynthesis protein ThiJ [Tsukamurella pulmonis]